MKITKAFVGGIVSSLVAASSATAATTVLDSFNYGVMDLEGPPSQSSPTVRVQDSDFDFVDRQGDFTLQGCNGRLSKCGTVKSNVNMLTDGVYELDLEPQAVGVYTTYLTYLTSYDNPFRFQDFDTLSLVADGFFQPSLENRIDTILGLNYRYSGLFEVTGVMSDDRTMIDFELPSSAEPIDFLRIKTETAQGKSSGNIGFRLSEIVLSDKDVTNPVVSTPEPSSARLLASLSVLSGIALISMFLYSVMFGTGVALIVKGIKMEVKNRREKRMKK